MSSVKQEKFKEVKAQHELLKKISFTSTLIKEINDSLFASNQAFVEFSGDDVNYQTMISIKLVERLFFEQGANVVSMYGSKKFILSITI
jgi:LPS O-antigen subunit length determinant protein (WzzB/FepE family)